MLIPTCYTIRKIAGLLTKPNSIRSTQYGWDSEVCGEPTRYILCPHHTCIEISRCHAANVYLGLSLIDLCILYLAKKSVIFIYLHYYN